MDADGTDWIDALTLINLPAGPTAYFRLTSIQMGDEIAVSDRRFSCPIDEC